MSYFSERYGKWAVIAGASQGIGEQFSRQLAAKGLNILMIARGVEDLERVSKEITVKHDVEVQVCSLDLADKDLATKLSEIVAGKEVGLVVYNATYSYIGAFMEDDLASKHLCVDVNCKGPLTFIQTLAPQMVERKRGGIILVSSMSGFQGSAMVANYAASKAYVTVLAEGLWEEFRHFGVDVMACVAGATRTPNFERQTPASKAGSAFPMTPEAVVSDALIGLEQGKGPTLITGRINRAVNFFLMKLKSRRGAVSFISNATRKLYG